MLHSTRSRRRLLGVRARSLALIAALALAAAIAVGCGGGSAKTTVTEAAAVAPATPARSKAGEPAAGDNDPADDGGHRAHRQHPRPDRSRGDSSPAHADPGHGKAKDEVETLRGGISHALRLVHCQKGSVEKACRRVKEAIERGSASVADAGNSGAPATVAAAAAEAAAGVPLGKGCPRALSATICERVEKITDR